jgi:hypothetical protein
MLTVESLRRSRYSVGSEQFQDKKERAAGKERASRREEKKRDTDKERWREAVEKPNALSAKLAQRPFSETSKERKAKACAEAAILSEVKAMQSREEKEIKREQKKGSEQI